MGLVMLDQTILRCGVGVGYELPQILHMYRIRGWNTGLMNQIVRSLMDHSESVASKTGLPGRFLVNSWRCKGPQLLCSCPVIDTWATTQNPHQRSLKLITGTDPEINLQPSNTFYTHSF